MMATMATMAIGSHLMSIHRCAPRCLLVTTQ
jgi:hypothetical protein